MARKLQLTNRCKRDLAELSEAAEWPRLDEVLRGVYFCIENDAESYLFSKAPVRVGFIKTLATDGAPALKFLFWIVSSDTIELDSVSLIEDPEI